MNLDAQLAQLETADLVRRAIGTEFSFQFRHTLTQETIYQSLLRAKRREMHAHTARAYEMLYPDRLDEFAALLAMHYAQAGDDAKTLEYATRAGDAAARLYANAEAFDFYSRAVEVAKRVGARHLPSQGFQQTGVALNQTDPPQDRARANASPLQDLYLKRGRVLELMGRIDDALANYREMQALAQERGDRALGELDRAEETLQAARALAERTTARQTLWQVWLEQSRLAEARDEPAPAKTFRAEARKTVAYLAEQMGDPELRAAFLALPDVRTAMES